MYDRMHEDDVIVLLVLSLSALHEELHECEK